MLRNLLILFSLAAFEAHGEPGLPIWLQDSYRWQQIQQQHLQTQQQLQAQDQYRRQLLQQDQDWQLQKLRDSQLELQDSQRSLIMRDHTDKLRLYSKPVNPSLTSLKVMKKKSKLF